MATVVLSAVGTYFGGPIGGAIGAAVGQQIDRAIIGPGKAREGPRIKELDIQTSSYGTQIPAIFGAMRIAGTVIWSTDLIEQRTKKGGRKSRPATINYSYSVSFAVALSSRPLARIGRIWADGNLLRGAAGDFKTETGFRFHSGHHDQGLDPLLASAEATGQCPAYRGTAYVVFEDLQLADFGNRIPSLTFEVFERETAVPVADIAAQLSADCITGQSAVTLTGYAAQGGDTRSALSPLFGAIPLTVSPWGDGLRLSDWSATSPNIMLADPAISDGKTRLDRPTRSRTANSRAPSALSIRHYEPDRDFQAGVQSSRRVGTARNETLVELPAAVDATSARQFADLQLLQRWRGLNSIEANIPLGDTSVGLGNGLAADGITGPMRVTEIEHQRGTARIVAAEWTQTGASAIGADPGRNLPGPDLQAGETRLILADLPALGIDDPGRPTIIAAAAGTGEGWRRAALSAHDGNRIIDLGGTNGVAVMGNLVDPLGAHNPQVEDRLHEPIVQLLHSGMSLPPGSGDPLAFDAPTLWIAGELLRYGNAEQVGPRDYRLKRLIRSCFGTEIPAGHPVGAQVFLLEPDTLFRIDAVPTPIGENLTVEALGIGDNLAVSQTIAASGAAITPRPPVHGQIGTQPDGGIRLRWIRRDRLAYIWADATDLPNSEGVVEFAVELWSGGAVLATWSIGEPELAIDAATLASFSLSAGANLEFRIRQVGRFAQSLPLVLQITI